MTDEFLGGLQLPSTEPTQPMAWIPHLTIKHGFVHLALDRRT